MSVSYRNAHVRDLEFHLLTIFSKFCFWRLYRPKGNQDERVLSQGLTPAETRTLPEENVLDANIMLTLMDPIA